MTSLDNVVQKAMGKGQSRHKDISGYFYIQVIVESNRIIGLNDFTN